MCAKGCIVIVGMGNILLRDEGIGSHISHALKGASLPCDVEIIDGGTSLDVLPPFANADKLIIIDAVSGGGEPGTIYRFKPKDIALESEFILSAHDIGLLESLRMMEVSDIGAGEIVIIGVEPKEMGWGLELSPQLQEKVPQIIQVVLAELDNGYKR